MTGWKRGVGAAMWLGFAAVLWACDGDQTDPVNAGASPTGGMRSTSGGPGASGTTGVSGTMGAGGSANAGSAQGGSLAVAGAATGGQAPSGLTDGGNSEPALGRPLTDQIITACSMLVYRYCARYEECEPDNVLSHYGDFEGCVAVEGSECESWMLLQGVTADEPHLAMLGDEILQESCYEVLRGVRAHITSPGTLAAGEECVLGPQCQSLHCDNTCGTPPDVPATPLRYAGESCDDVSELCADHFDCSGGICESNLSGPECSCEQGATSCTQCPYWQNCGQPGINGMVLCSEKPKLGEQCMDNMFNNCPSALECINGLCEVPPPTWEQ